MFTQSHFHRIRSMDDIFKISPTDFEYFCKFLLENIGYQQVYVTKKFGVHHADGGIDIHCKREGQKFLVQCKQWRKGFKNKNSDAVVDNMKVSAVRELGGCLLRDQVAQGIFMSTLNYDSSTTEEAAKMHIHLIGHSDIESHMRQINPQFGQRKSFWQWIFERIVDFLHFYFKL